jgi:hypothetical protein
MIATTRVLAMRRRAAAAKLGPAGRRRKGRVN